MTITGLTTTGMLAMALLLVGCAPVQQGKAATPNGDEPAAPLVTKDDFLQLAGCQVPDVLKNTVEIRDYGVEITKDEQLPELRLQLFNRLVDKPLHLEIRTVWFREDGSVIDASAWAKALVPPRRAYRYRCLANSPYSPFAVDEQVQLRRLYVGDVSEQFPPMEDATP